MPSLRPAALAAALLAGPPAFAADGPLLGQACLGCHGAGAQGAMASPALAGRPAAAIVAQMAAFRSGERPATIMGRIARGYSEPEVEAVSAYLAQLPQGPGR